MNPTCGNKIRNYTYIYSGSCGNVANVFNRFMKMPNVFV